MTLFDILTVVFFMGIVTIFFVFTDRSPRLLSWFLLSGVILAVANQVGNHGYVIVAAALAAAAVTIVAMQFTNRA